MEAEKFASEIIDLERRISSLTELERESEAEGNESLAAVLRARKKKAEAYRDLIARREV